MFKVTYETLAIMSDGRVGNVYQGGGTAYTDVPLEHVRPAIDIYLDPKRRVCEIIKIESVKGHVIANEK